MPRSVRSTVAAVSVVSAVALLASTLAVSACGRGAPPEPVEMREGAAVLPEEDGTKRITPQQVAWLGEQGVPLLFVDSRSREDHARGRPAGSVSVPLSMIELAAARLPGDRLIVTFCT